LINPILFILPNILFKYFPVFKSNIGNFKIASNPNGG